LFFIAGLLFKGVTVKLTKLSPSDQTKESLSKDVVYYSKKGSAFDGFTDGLPLSRITIYTSGANRIQRTPSTAPPENILRRKKNDIFQFSYGARRRYFDYVNSLDFSGFFVYRYDFTISTNIEPYIITRRYPKTSFYQASTGVEGLTYETSIISYKEVNDLFFIRKDLLRYLSKEGFDCVYKIEYTLGCPKDVQLRYQKIYLKECNYECFNCDFGKNCRPTPHFHLIAWRDSEIPIDRNHNWIDEAREKGSVFTRLVFARLGLWNGNNLTDDLLRVYENMRLASVKFSVPSDEEDLRKKIFYLSFYFTKDKNYQNFIPDKYLGIKMWGYSRENYGDLRVDPTIIPITQNIYDNLLFQEIRNDVVESKKIRCKKRSLENCEICSLRHCEIFNKRNGLFSVKMDDYYNQIIDNNIFSSVLSEAQFNKIIDKKD